MIRNKSILNVLVLYILYACCSINNVKSSISNSDDKNSERDLNEAIGKLEAEDNLYQAGLNKFIFIKINKKETDIMYFQLLIEEYFLTNGVSTRSFASDDETMVLVVNKFVNITSQDLKTNFGKYIIDTYLKVN